MANDERRNGRRSSFAIALSHRLPSAPLAPDYDYRRLLLVLGFFFATDLDLLDAALVELCFFRDAETCLRECLAGGFQPTALSARKLAGIAMGPSA